MTRDQHAISFMDALPRDVRDLIYVYANVYRDSYKRVLVNLQEKMEVRYLAFRSYHCNRFYNRLLFMEEHDEMPDFIIPTDSVSNIYFKTYLQ